MKSIQESIIGRRGSEYWYKLHNPKLKDLQHLDVVKCANDNIYICIDPSGLRVEPVARINDFNAYRIINGRVSSLGLANYSQNLNCRHNNEFDIVAVYRGLFTNNKDYPSFRVIWDILQEKMKFIV